jgi:hypothetical protein
LLFSYLLVLSPLAARADEARLPGYVPPIGDRYFAEVGTVEAGPFLFHNPLERDAQTGYLLDAAQLATVRVGAFQIAGGTGTAFRLFGAHGAAASFTYQSVASVRLGPIEPEVGLLLDTFTLDVVRGKVSFEFLSPRASAGASVRLTHRLLIGVSVYTEYLWRWLGDDVRMTGAFLSLRVDGSRTYGWL